MKKAKVIYNEKEDAFEIHINTGDGYGLCTSYRCFTIAKDPNGDPNFISFTVLKKLAELELFGYEITFRNLL